MPATESIPYGDGQSADFKLGVFTKPGPIPDTIRIYWGWSTDGKWSAPGAPRFTFARHPSLYKMYVISRVRDPRNPDQAGTTARAFLDLFLPALQKALAPKQG